MIKKQKYTRKNSMQQKGAHLRNSKLVLAMDI